MLTDTFSSATKLPNRLVTLRTSMLTWGPLHREGRCRAGWSVSSLPVLRPQQRDDDNADDRCRREQERDRVRRVLVEVLVLLLDHEGGRLGLSDDVARHDLDRPELTERTSQAQYDAVDDGPPDRRQGDSTKRL